MTADLETVLNDYRADLDAELTLLGELETLAQQQRALPHPADPERLTALSQMRERHLSALAALEARAQDRRQRVARDLDAAQKLPAFAGVADRHRLATALVARILQLDKDSLAVLQQADTDRRAAAHTLDTGEATLAAYRRILQQPHPSAGLFTERG